jgi:hypothetical protein
LVAASAVQAAATPAAHAIVSAHADGALPNGQPRHPHRPWTGRRRRQIQAVGRRLEPSRPLPGGRLRGGREDATGSDPRFLRRRHRTHPPVQWGDVEVRALNWSTDPAVTPEQAADDLADRVEEWLSYCESALEAA